MSMGQIFSLMFYPYNKSILSKNSIAHRTFSGHTPFRRKLALATCFSPVFEEKKIVSLSVPVSYTHLDVYKRQGSLRTACPHGETDALSFSDQTEPLS